MTLSIIVPTKGRDTLSRTLTSLAYQLGDGDEILVIRNDDAPYGNKTRDAAMARCVGTHIWFMDDDDTAAPRALQAIRAALDRDPNAVHIFRMDTHGNLIWTKPELRNGDVGTPMIVVPNVPGKLGTWGDEYEGDAHFVLETVALRGDQPIFHEEIVALIRP